jgi:flagellar capping protein FliD
MRGLTPSFKITYSEALQHTEEAINTEIKERDKKIQSLVEMIDDLESRIKDQNVVLDSNKN